MAGVFMDRGLIETIMEKVGGIVLVWWFPATGRYTAEMRWINGEKVLKGKSAETFDAALINLNCAIGEDAVEGR